MNPRVIDFMPRFFSVALRRSATVAAVFVATTSVFAWGARIPVWVERVPPDSNYYNGIGMASKKGALSAAYRDLARHRALRNLSMQISTTVSSRFVLNTVETTGLTEEEVKSEILTLTESHLEGYEFVESYETRTEYWEFYRFDKDTCRIMQERVRARAIAAAAAFLTEARLAEQRRDMVSALRLYCQVVSELQGYMGEHPSEFIQAQVGLERILSGIRLTADRPEMPAVEGEAFRTPAIVACVSLVEDTAEPARNLPVRFEIEGNGGAPVTHGVADENGQVKLQMGIALPGMNGTAVHARVDLAKLMDTEKICALFTGFLSCLSLPEAAISLRVFPAADRDAFLWHWGFAGKRVVVYAGYSADGKTAAWNKMRDEMAKILTNIGATVVPGSAPIEAVIGWTGESHRIWTHDTDIEFDSVIVATATGQFNRRDSSSSPFGKNCQFTGEIRTFSTLGAVPDFSDRYQAVGGWNPMGEDMTIDVIAVHAYKRWQAALLKHLGSK